eukprot:SAG22_NODE_662_length_8055_cov_5.450980_5_plen_567_part_00
MQVTKVEAGRLSGNPSRAPGSACLMQTVRYGVTAAFLRQSNADLMASPAGAAAAGGDDAMVMGTPILYVEEPGADPVAGVITAITPAETGRGEKTYDILLQEFIPVTIDKLNEKKGGGGGGSKEKDKENDKDKELLYNVVLDAQVVHVGRSGDAIDKPVPIEELRPMPRSWDPEQSSAASAAEPKCFAPTDADSGDTGVAPGAKVLFERVSASTQKKLKLKHADLPEPHCHRVLRQAAGGKSAGGGGRLVPVDAATLAVNAVVMVREAADVDKKQIEDGEELFAQGQLEVGGRCRVNRGWQDRFEPSDAVIYALKYPNNSLTKQPDKSKPPRYACVFTNRYKRSRVRKVHLPSQEAAAAAAEPEVFVDVVWAPLLEATVTETFEKAFDLDFGEKQLEAGLPQHRLQLLRRVQVRGAATAVAVGQPHAIDILSVYLQLLNTCLVGAVGLAGLPLPPDGRGAARAPPVGAAARRGGRNGSGCRWSSSSSGGGGGRRRRRGRGRSRRRCRRWLVAVPGAEAGHAGDGGAAAAEQRRAAAHAHRRQEGRHLGLRPLPERGPARRGRRRLQ